VGVCAFWSFLGNATKRLSEIFNPNLSARYCLPESESDGHTDGLRSAAGVVPVGVTCCCKPAINRCALSVTTLVLCCFCELYGCAPSPSGLWGLRGFSCAFHLLTRGSGVEAVFRFLGSGVDSRGKKGRKGSEGWELGSGVRLQCKTSPM